ncbi:hypothetical protein H4R24_003140 [Coemansia sp. RSA 988]|nr:hypothetical protein H4R24_003140 [Coemansia sp. RSA 988]
MFSADDNAGQYSTSDDDYDTNTSVESDGNSENERKQDVGEKVASDLEGDTSSELNPTQLGHSHYHH